jgi:hypothetical protein
MASVSGILMVKLEPCPHRLHVDAAADLIDVVAHHVHADAAAGHAGDLCGGREAGRENELLDLGFRHLVELGLGDKPVGQSLFLDPLDVEAAAVIGDADDDMAAFVIGGQPDDSPSRACQRRSGRPRDSRPWSAELRTMWVSGSLMRSSTWRSSSVSAPCNSSSMSLPSSAERSRMTRGSFCQALPIGCMRVRMTPSCSSAVTLEQPLQRHLEFGVVVAAHDVEELVAGQHQLGHHGHQAFRACRR